MTRRQVFGALLTVGAVKAQETTNVSDAWTLVSTNEKTGQKTLIIRLDKLPEDARVEFWNGGDVKGFRRDEVVEGYFPDA